MVGPHSNIWSELRKKYTLNSNFIGQTSGEWPAQHTDRSTAFSERLGANKRIHETLVKIITANGSREEEKEACLEIMNNLKEVMLYPENSPDQTNGY